MFKSLTNNPNLKISVESNEPKKVTKNKGDFDSLLGKRKERESDEAVVEDDGQVISVTEEFIPTSKPKEKKKTESNLPQSIKEKYGMVKVKKPKEA